ncbi:UNVERIFIED_CONTAM: hypothetical protein FKN15_008369 [Acipenser sinensis]
MVTCQITIHKQKVMEEVQRADHVYLTDMWTSINTEAYLAVTGHFISHQPKLNSFLLDISHFKRTHTSGHITEPQLHLMDTWNLRDKITSFITDNAANMVAAIRNMNICHLPCFAHTLNLIVKNASQNTPDLELVQEKARRIVGFFRSSSNAKERLSEFQILLNKPQHKLVQEVDTRWNSTYEMFKACGAKRIHCCSGCHLTYRYSSLNSAECEIMKECLGVNLGTIFRTKCFSFKNHPPTRMLQCVLSQKHTSPCS